MQHTNTTILESSVSRNSLTIQRDLPSTSSGDSIITDHPTSNAAEITLRKSHEEVFGGIQSSHTPLMDIFLDTLQRDLRQTCDRMAQLSSDLEGAKDTIIKLSSELQALKIQGTDDSHTGTAIQSTAASSISEAQEAQHSSLDRFDEMETKLTATLDNRLGETREAFADYTAKMYAEIVQGFQSMTLAIAANTKVNLFIYLCIVSDSICLLSPQSMDHASFLQVTSSPRHQQISADTAGAARLAIPALLTAPSTSSPSILPSVSATTAILASSPPPTGSASTIGVNSADSSASLTTIANQSNHHLQRQAYL